MTSYIKTALPYVTPSAVTALKTIYNSYSAANTPRDTKDKSKGYLNNLNEGQNKAYNEAKLTVINVALGIAAFAASYKFGVKLGDDLNKAVALTAVVLSGSLKHGAVAYSLSLSGKASLNSFTNRDYTSFAKNAGLVLATLMASSDALKNKVYGIIAPYIESVK